MHSQVRELVTNRCEQIKASTSISHLVPTHKQIPHAYNKLQEFLFNGIFLVRKLHNYKSQTFIVRSNPLFENDNLINKYIGVDWAIIINFSHKISPYKINDKLYEAIKFSFKRVFHIF